MSCQKLSLHHLDQKIYSLHEFFLHKLKVARNVFKHFFFCTDIKTPLMGLIENTGTHLVLLKHT